MSSSNHYGEGPFLGCCRTSSRRESILSDYKTLRKSLKKEPIPTPSQLAGTIDCLREVLAENIVVSQTEPRSTLVSSNALANRFIMNHWDIRPSQRKRYKNLFLAVRRRTRRLFEGLLAKERIELEAEDTINTILIHKFDDVRGNIILAFREIPQGAEYKYGFR